MEKKNELLKLFKEMTDSFEQYSTKMLGFLIERADVEIVDKISADIYNYDMGNLLYDIEDLENSELITFLITHIYFNKYYKNLPEEE